MSFKNLSINFNNLREAENDIPVGSDQDSSSTLKAVGINIYDQHYRTNKCSTSRAEYEEIRTLLNNLIKRDDDVELDYVDPSNTAFLTGLETVEIDSDQVATGKTDNVYLMDKNQVVVFECKQTYNNKNYFSYYCYLVDKNKNTWLIYIYNWENSGYSPIVIDLQDKFVPKLIGTSGDSGKVYTGIMTGNFNLLADSNTTVINYETHLTNTVFNIPNDVSLEDDSALISPFGILVSEDN